MSEWRPIETAPKIIRGDMLVSDGSYVVPAWYCTLPHCPGWHDSRNQDYDDEPIDPQPRYWRYMPEPPNE